jgi:hypothetical protein
MTQARQNGRACKKWKVGVSSSTNGGGDSNSTETTHQELRNYINEEGLSKMLETIMSQYCTLQEYEEATYDLGDMTCWHCTGGKESFPVIRCLL